MPRLTLQSLAQELAQLKARVAVLEARQTPAAARPLTEHLPEVTNQPPLESARSLVQAIFAVALNGPQLPEEEAFQAFRELVHAHRRGTPLLDEELRSYKWRPLLQRCRQYLSRPDDPSSFVIERCQPETVTAQTDQVRLYLRADKRMPPPITLKRDPGAGGAWRLEASSL